MKKLIANDYNALDVLKENPNGGYFGKHKDGNKPNIRLIYTDNLYLIKEKMRSSAYKDVKALFQSAYRLV